jgi:hypothetical protein
MGECEPFVTLSACRQTITGGGIRTHTGITAQTILSPQRLPFRHAGKVLIEGLPPREVRRTDTLESRARPLSSGEVVHPDDRDIRTFPSAPTKPAHQTPQPYEIPPPTPGVFPLCLL